jgi:hypothetical protein
MSSRMSTSQKKTHVTVLIRCRWILCPTKHRSYV